MEKLTNTVHKFSTFLVNQGKKLLNIALNQFNLQIFSCINCPNTRFNEADNLRIVPLKMASAFPIFHLGQLCMCTLGQVECGKVGALKFRLPLLL
jgi:hypothetical protein